MNNPNILTQEELNNLLSSYEPTMNQPQCNKNKISEVIDTYLEASQTIQPGHVIRNEILEDVERLLHKKTN